MFSKVLIATRGEIAVRIARSLRKMGVPSVVIHCDADRDSAHVTAAEEAVAIGAAAPSASHLDGARILAEAVRLGVDAIMPGYGFLSENAAFAEACEAAGIAFTGPTPDQMRRFGLKHSARAIAEAAGVPLAPGTGLLRDLDEALAAARGIGFPSLLKSTAGGGGIGLRRCDDEAQLIAAFESGTRSRPRACRASRPTSTARRPSSRHRRRSSRGGRRHGVECSRPRRRHQRQREEAAGRYRRDGRGRSRSDEDGVRRACPRRLPHREPALPAGIADHGRRAARRDRGGVMRARPACHGATA